MKKILFVVILGSFLGLSINAQACDEHKAKAKKASTSVTGAATATKVADKKECTPAEKAACGDTKVMKASTTTSKAAGCCSSKATKTTTTEAATPSVKKGS